MVAWDGFEIMGWAVKFSKKWKVFTLISLGVVGLTGVGGGLWYMIKSLKEVKASDWEETKEAWNIEVIAFWAGGWSRKLASNAFPTRGNDPDTGFEIDYGNTSIYCFDYIMKHGQKYGSDAKSLTLYYIKYRYKIPSTDVPRIGIFEFQHHKPAPPKQPAPKPPQYQWYHSVDVDYYPTQLVARFFEFHKTLAHLDKWGNVTFETVPNLYLRRPDGLKEATGRILRIYPCAPNMYMFTIIDESFSPWKLRQFMVATKQENWIPKDIPWTHEHKLKVLDKDWEGYTLEVFGNSHTYNIKPLRNGSIVTPMKELHAFFAFETMVEDIPKEVDGVEDPNKLESRRILAINYPKANNPLVKDLDGTILKGAEDFKDAMKLYGFQTPQKIVRFRIEREAKVEKIPSEDLD